MVKVSRFAHILSVGLTIGAVSAMVVMASGPALAAGPRDAGSASASSSAGSARRLLLSESEFKSLAIELANKVNLFRDVWEVDPKAEFFGGTSRDYLYWLKGRLAKAKDANELRQVISTLRSQEIIDVREFILYESDVDVVSREARQFKADGYGVKKIDSIRPDRFDARTPEGQNEIHQGYIPAEKIRLGKTGFGDSSVFGDGVGEIYRSKLSIHFASDAEFAQTEYAKKGLNHPVLLALRYIRLLAIDYFQNNGGGAPDKALLMNGADPASAAKVASVIEAATLDPKVAELLKNAKFRDWMNQTIQKAFRSYTNTTATRLLFTRFKADLLVSAFEGLETINQYLFAVHRDEAKIRENWRQSGVDPRRVLEPASKHFSNRHLYHGTKTEAAFRAILFQGTLPSESGNAGSGLYGVEAANVAFAVGWGGDENRVAQIEIATTAKVVDITLGAGKELFDSYRASHPQAKDVYSEFAEAYGADILKYPYSSSATGYAYVVKNGAVLKRIDGYRRKLMKFSEAIEWVRNKSDLTLRDVEQMSDVNHFSERERELVMREPNVKQAIENVRLLPLDQIIIHIGLTGNAERTARLVEMVPEKFGVAYETFELSDFMYATARGQALRTLKIQGQTKAKELLAESYVMSAQKVLSTLTEANLLWMIEQGLTKKASMEAFSLAIAEMKKRAGDMSFYDFIRHWNGRWADGIGKEAGTYQNLLDNKLLRGMPVANRFIRQLVLQRKIPDTWLGVAWTSPEEVDSALGRSFFTEYVKIMREEKFELKFFEHFELPKTWSVYDEFVLWNMVDWGSNGYEYEYKLMRLMNRWSLIGAEKVTPEQIDALWEIIEKTSPYPDWVDDRTPWADKQSYNADHNRYVMASMLIMGRFKRLAEAKSLPQIHAWMEKWAQGMVLETGMKPKGMADYLILEPDSIRGAQASIRAAVAHREAEAAKAQVAPVSPVARPESASSQKISQPVPQAPRSCKAIFTRLAPVK